MATDSLAFHHWIDPAGRISAPVGTYTLDVTAADRTSIAAWLGIPALPFLSARIEIARTGLAEATAKGMILADAELVCSVSLDNFVERFEIPVQATFRRGSTGLPKGDDSISSAPQLALDEDEPREWGLHGIDLGTLIAEELSLALPDFPRKPGARLPEDAESDEAEPRINPFDVLKKLKNQP